MSDIKLQAELSMDTSQGEASVDKFGKAINKMARETEAEAKKAEDALKKIPTAFQAEKMDREFRSMTASIKRTTEQMELMGKTASQKLEFKINAKGLDPAQFEPALQKMREIEAQSIKAGLAGTASLNNMGMSAAATANAMRNVPAQFTDIITSLQGGQKPMTVLLQQGGQLKDLFGGIGPAAKALGGYVMGMVNPFTLAAAAAGTLAVAYYQGGKEAENYNKALILSGNIAGTTTAKMADMARALGDGKYTQSAAAAAIAELAQSGAVAGDRLQKFAAIAIDVERATGQATSKTAEAFKELEKAPLEATVKLNDSLHYLTLGTYEQIKALTEQGRVTDAARLAIDTYADAMGARAKQVTENAGALERSWKAVGSAASWAWDKMLGVGRDMTGSEQLAALKAKLASLNSGTPLQNASLGDSIKGAFDPEGTVKRLKAETQEQIALMERLGAAQQKSAETNAADLKIVEAKTIWDKESEKFLSKQQQLKREILKTEVEGQALLKQGAITQAQYAERLANVRDKYKEAATKAASTSGQSEVASIRAKIVETETYIKTLKEQGIAGKEMNEGEKLAVKIQKELEGSLKGVARANKEAALVDAQKLALRLKERDAILGMLKSQKEFEALRDREISGQEASILKMEEKARAMEDEVRMYGMGKEAIEALSIARLREKIDILAGFDGSAEQIALIEKEIDARKRLAVATDAKAAKAEWTKFYDSIYNGLTDSLFRAFEAGKGFFSTLWSGIKNMFKTTVLKLAIQGVVGGVTGLAATAASAAGYGGISNGLSAAGTGSSLLSAGSITLGGSTIAAIGSSVATGISAGLAGTSLAPAIAAYGSAGMTGVATGLSAGSSIGAGLAAIGPAGWAALAVLAVTAVASQIKGDSRFGSQADYSAATGSRSFGGPNGAADNFGGVTEATATAATSINALLAKLGSAQTVGYFNSGFESSEKGKGFSYAGGTLSNGTQFGQGFGTGYMNNRGSMNAEEAAASYANELKQATLQALQSATDIPKSIAATLAGVNIDALTGDALNQLIATVDKQITELANFGTALDLLPFTQLQGMSLSAVDALAQLTGGLDALGGKLASYYENFYSEEEKRVNTIRNITGVLNAAGASLSAADFDTGGILATREQFRALAESTDRSSPLFAALVNVNEAFSSITPAAQSAAAALAAQAAAQTAALQAAYTASQAGVASALESVKRAIAAEKERIGVIRDVAAESVRSITGVFGLLKEQINQLYGSVNSTQAMQAAQGNAFIDQALSAAQTTGYLPDQQQLADAIAAARGGLDANQYTSQFEADKAALIMAGKLSQLQTIGGKQLTSAELALKATEDQLKALDDVLETAKQQLDALYSIDNSVLSIADAMQKLADAMSGMTGAIIAAMAAGMTKAPDALKQIAAASGGTLKADAWNSVKTASGMQDVWASAGGAAALKTATGQQIYAKDGSQFSATDAIASVTSNLAANNAAQVYADATRTGISAASLDALMGWGAGTANAWATANELPKFVSGGNHQGGLRIVGENGPELEATGPSRIFNASQTRDMLSGSGNTARLEALVEGLTTEVQRLQSIVNNGNMHAQRTANAVNGNPEQPMLVETV